MEGLPFFLCMPTYRTNPSIRTSISEGHIAADSDGGMIISEDPTSLSAKLALYQADYLAPKLDHISFARMLAKIALGYCIIQFGRDSFTPLTNPLILGKTNGYPNFISSSQSAETGHSQTPLEQRYHHEFSHRIAQDNGLICVRIELFINLAAPTYYVMAGAVGQGKFRFSASSNS
jgi:hypothetical protein